MKICFDDVTKTTQFYITITSRGFLFSNLNWETTRSSSKCSEDKRWFKKVPKDVTLYLGRRRVFVVCYIPLRKHYVWYKYARSQGD